MSVTYRLPAPRIAAALGLWRNIHVQRFVFQAAFAALIIGFGYLLLSNLDRSLTQTNLELFPFLNIDATFPFVHISGDFLNERAGFSLDDRSFGFDYSANDSYLRAFQTGLLNTVQVALIGIVLATVLGIVAGISRLSTNWLVSQVAMVYVETFRNVPLLVQLIFWYLAVFLKLPRIADSLDFFGIAFLSNRSVALPSVAADGEASVWLLLLAAAVIPAAFVRRVRARREDNTGHPSYPWLWAIATFFLIAAAGFFATGMPLSIDVPERGPTAYAGGWQMTPEYAALLTGLVVYTGAFIAEIVRGAILAIPRSQTDAAAALGLNAFQRMRYVILPQALRIIIPPLTNQFLNLTKNSSLAVAVGFKELFDVGRISISQTGQAVPIITLLMLTYLTISLLTSLVMNGINSRLKWGVR
jgi:general L-amino acid transport system permease protein